MEEMLMQDDLSFLSRWVPPEERPSKERLKELIRAYIHYSSQLTSEEETTPSSLPPQQPLHH